MVFYWSLSDSKSPQESSFPLIILVTFNNSLVWIVTTRRLISECFSSYTNLLVSVPSAPITIGITIIIMFHSFFTSLARTRYLSFRLFGFIVFRSLYSNFSLVHFKNGPEYLTRRTAQWVISMAQIEISLISYTWSQLVLCKQMINLQQNSSC